MICRNVGNRDGDVTSPVVHMSMQTGIGMEKMPCSIHQAKEWELVQLCARIWKHEVP